MTDTPLHRELVPLFDAVQKNLEQCEFKVARTDGGLGSSKNLIVKVPEELRQVTDDLVRKYKSWSHSMHGQWRSSLTKSDCNLFRACTTKALSYFELDRRGGDLEKKEYLSFFHDELYELLEYQSRIISKVESTPKSQLTVGVEEELLLIDPTTGDLVDKADELIEGLKASMGESVGPEAKNCQIEIKTEPHALCKFLDEDLRNKRKTLVLKASEFNLGVIASGTHPFSDPRKHDAYKSERAHLFIHDLQDSVRQLMICGQHVHVGIPEDKDRLDLMNQARSYLPILLGLSANSPFWVGYNTGYHSYRTTRFKMLPRTGIPPVFNSKEEYDSYVKLLGTTKSFDSTGATDPRKIWWDIRPHPSFPTLEFRIADSCARIEDSLCLAALCRAICAKLLKIDAEGMIPRPVSYYLLEENKWRASRYGVRANLIDFRTGKAVPFSYLWYELRDFIDDVLDDDSRRYVDWAETIINEGSYSTKQVRVWESADGEGSKAMRAVVEDLQHTTAKL